MKRGESPPYSTAVVERHIEELRHTVLVAGLNFDIWWTYKQRRSRARHLDVLNRYPLFFQAGLHAHFVALVIALYRVYESRKDTHNVHRLIAELDKLGAPRRDIASFKRRVAGAKPQWIKIGILRNEAFGHRAQSGTYDDVLRKAQIKPNDIRRLIRRSQTLLNRISLVANRSVHAFGLDVSRDTTRVLETLDAHYRRSP